MSFQLHGAAGPITGHNHNDADGNPAGGVVEGVGFRIDWQNGPLGRGADRKAATGAFAVDVLLAVKERFLYYQEGKFACAENDAILDHLVTAIDIENQRTADREARQVEGTHAV